MGDNSLADPSPVMIKGVLIYQCISLALQTNIRMMTPLMLNALPNPIYKL